jgi:hypothetical protein
MTHTGEPQCGDCEYINDNPDISQYGTVYHDWRCLLRNNERVYPVAFACKDFMTNEDLPIGGN